MNLRDLISSVSSGLQKGKENLTNWAKIASNPTQRQEFNQSVIQPAVQSVVQNNPVSRQNIPFTINNAVGTVQKLTRPNIPFTLENAAKYADWSEDVPSFNPGVKSLPSAYMNAPQQDPNLERIKQYAINQLNLTPKAKTYAESVPIVAGQQYFSDSMVPKQRQGLPFTDAYSSNENGAPWIALEATPSGTQGWQTIAHELMHTMPRGMGNTYPGVTEEDFADQLRPSEEYSHILNGGKLPNYGAGNIDLNNRPIVKNPDGSISTVRSISINQDGKEILIPTVINGNVVSNDEAIKHYQQTGQYLGKFDNVNDANNYATQLHNSQERQYVPAQQHTLVDLMNQIVQQLRR